MVVADTQEPLFGKKGAVHRGTGGHARPPGFRLVIHSPAGAAESTLSYLTVECIPLRDRVWRDVEL
jgi:hypothetical protein